MGGLPRTFALVRPAQLAVGCSKAYRPSFPAPVAATISESSPRNVVQASERKLPFCSALAENVLSSFVADQKSD